MSDVTYFDLLDLPRRFDLSAEVLEEKYLSKQQQLHPDVAGAQSTKEASLVSQAYEVLKDPVQRSFYLLKLSGYDAGDMASYIMSDQDVLEHVMEVQELIALSQDYDEMLELRVEVEKQLDTLLMLIEHAFSVEQYDQMLEYTCQYQYHKKLVDDLRFRLKILKH